MSHDERRPTVANDHEHKGTPREPLDIENGAEFPPHEIRRDA
jgi:hypothetical protein